MKETPFKQMMKKWLDQNHHWHIKYWAGAKYTKEGIPDILACIYGRFYGLELKGDDGKPKLLQLVNLQDIRNAGGIGLLLYPDDFKNFKSFVEDPLSKTNYEWYRTNIEKQKFWYTKLSLG
jgi:hypothetical protein